MSSSWPTRRSHLQRSPEQRLLDLNSRYDRVLKFYDVAWDASDGQQDPKLRETADCANGHALRMMREIREEALIIPATTVRAVALKARIMSEAKQTWWDPQAGDQDRDARVLIEDILALAGLDRIHPRSFEFTDLLPGYDGPKLFEGYGFDSGLPSSTPPAAPAQSSSFWTETAGDGVYRSTTHPEGALISFAGSVSALQEQESEAWKSHSDLSDVAFRARLKSGRRKVASDGEFDEYEREVGCPAALAVAISLSAALKEALRVLAGQPARTPEGLAAKAGLLVAIDDWGADGFGELALAVANDALWIGTQSRFQLSHLDALVGADKVISQVSA